jgi:TAP42-like family
MLVPFFAGEVLSQSREREHRVRLVSMTLACRQLKTFLRRCQQYGLLLDSVAKAVEQMASGERADPRDARSLKVEQRKQLVTLATKLRGLQDARDGRHADAEGTQDKPSSHRFEMSMTYGSRLMLVLLSQSLRGKRRFVAVCMTADWTAVCVGSA